MEIDPDKSQLPAETGPTSTPAQVTTAVAAQECAQLAPLILSQVRSPEGEIGAGEGVRDEECERLEPHLEALQGIEYTHIDSYGPVGLAWGTTGERSALLFLVEDTDQVQRVAAIHPGAPDYQSVDEGTESVQETVSRFVTALREGDCNAMGIHALQVREGGLYPGSLDQAAMCHSQRGSRSQQALQENPPTTMHILAETTFGGLYGIPAGEVYLVVHATGQPTEIRLLNPGLEYGVKNHYPVQQAAPQG